jgi:hypothetical protein
MRQRPAGWPGGGHLPLQRPMQLSGRSERVGRRNSFRGQIWTDLQSALPAVSPSRAAPPIPPNWEPQIAPLTRLRTWHQTRRMPRGRGARNSAHVFRASHGKGIWCQLTAVPQHHLAATKMKPHRYRHHCLGLWTEMKRTSFACQVHLRLLVARRAAMYLNGVFPCHLPQPHRRRLVAAPRHPTLPNRPNLPMWSGHGREIFWMCRRASSRRD